MVRITIEAMGNIRVMKNNVYETEMQKNNRKRNIILKLQQDCCIESHFFCLNIDGKELI